MKAKKKVKTTWQTPEVEQRTLGITEHTFVHYANHAFHMSNANYLKVQITTSAESGKNQSTPTITNHLFTCYLYCVCKSNPVCLIQQWSVISLLDIYVQ